MDRNGIIVLVFLHLIYATDVAIANSQNLAAVAPKDNSTSTQVSGANAPDPKPIEADKSNQGVIKDAPAPSNSSQSDPERTDKTNSSTPSPQIPATEDPSNLKDKNSSSSPVQIPTKGIEKQFGGSNTTDSRSPTMNNTDNEKNIESYNATNAVSPVNNGTIPKDSIDRNSVTPSSPSPVEKTDNVKEDYPVDKADNTKNHSSGDRADNAKNDTPVNSTDNAKNDSPVDRADNDNTDSPVSKADNAKTDSPVDKGDNAKNNIGVQEKSIGDKSKESGVNETCLVSPNRCRDQKWLVACIHNLDPESIDLTILVQNEGDQTLRVNFAAPAEVGMPPRVLEIPQHQIEKVNIIRTVRKSLKLILDAGDGECVLHLEAVEPEENNNTFLQFPSYEKIVTPINGAYFLIVTVVVLGVAWGCCMFRRRRRHDGVPYQELEMGLPESVSATNLETAEGWDQGWDDNWDDEAAVKSPGAPRVGSISANGLTARSANRDGWENGWDD